MSRFATVQQYDTAYPDNPFPRSPHHWVAVAIDAVDDDGTPDTVVDFLPDGLHSDLPADTVGNIIVCTQAGNGGFVEVMAENVTRGLARQMRAARRPVGDTRLKDYREWLTAHGARVLPRLVDEDEVLTWYSQWRSFQWMAEQYQSKYGIQTNPSIWGNVFKRLVAQRPHLPHRDELLPWEEVQDHHRFQRPALMLLTEAKRRAGIELPAESVKAVTAWAADLQQRGVVVHYSPRTGFSEVPREATDTDIVRRPGHTAGTGQAATSTHAPRAD